MPNLSAAPESRSPKAIVQEWRHEAARMEVAVALLLMLSICALLFAITRDSPVASIVVTVLA